MKPVSLTSLCLIVLLAMPVLAQAAIYKYVDQSGRMVFVDDVDKIPPQYRQQTSTIGEEAPANDTAETYVDTPEQEEPAGEADATEAAAEAEEATAEESNAQVIVDRELETKARREADLQVKRRAFQTPIIVDGNRITVPVEVAMGNRVAHLLLLLDTGATATVFHRQALSELDLPTGQKIKARVAGGSTVTSEKIQFHYIEVGPFREMNSYAMVIDPKGTAMAFDGMLGMDFLKSHPYTIDYENEMLSWELQ